MKATYRHTNIVAADWRALAGFYEDVFGCTPVPPSRDLSGAWLDRGTGVPDAHLTGIHLRLPGHGDRGPTLEIYGYSATEPRPAVAANREGIAHIAFEVDDVAAAARLVVAHGGGLRRRRDVRGGPGGRPPHVRVRRPTPKATSSSCRRGAESAGGARRGSRRSSSSRRRFCCRSPWGVARRATAEGRPSPGAPPARPPRRRGARAGPSTTAPPTSRSRVQGTVERLLADDEEGSRHQRFILRLASGQTLLVAHNIDVAPRVDEPARGRRGRLPWRVRVERRGRDDPLDASRPVGDHAPGWLRHGGRTVPVSAPGRCAGSTATPRARTLAAAGAAGSRCRARASQ